MDHDTFQILRDLILLLDEWRWQIPQGTETRDIIDEELKNVKDKLAKVVIK